MLDRTPVTMLQCSACGAEANAACACGVHYVLKSVRAAEAIAKNPEKSDRAIAETLGVNQSTVSRVRSKSTDADASVGKRTGKDGRTRRVPQKKATKSKKSGRKRQPDACDYDWSNVREADFGSPTKAYRAQAEHYRREAIHLATAYPLLSVKIDTKIITEKEIQAVRSVVQAWSDVVDNLVRRSKKVA